MSQKTIHVFLSHGLESGPGSTKIQALKLEAEKFDGVSATALDHTNSKDPSVRLEQMHRAIDAAGARPETTVLAGSSMGGWVCAQTSANVPVLGCFLLAPALTLPSYPNAPSTIGARHTQIIHGWQDDVVEPMPVIQAAQQQGLPILVLPDGHRLQDSLDRIVAEFRLFMMLCLDLD
ncbi:MAG: alpha/beta hydrolase [Oleiphilaceae bacterium]|nr:alpha/beta hydrolase [Oleiphilaceae bacterium]